jgi:hypothetical protein
MMVTKGCISCHSPGGDKDVAMRHLSAEHVKAVLTDPALLRSDMPDLGLKPAETSALAAHLASGPDRQPKRQERPAPNRPRAHSPVTTRATW